MRKLLKLARNTKNMINKPTYLTKGFELVDFWFIRFELVGLLDWTRSSTLNRLSIRNSLKREIKKKIKYSLP